MAKGQIGSLNELREVVKNSTDIKTYTPSDTSSWDGAYAQFEKML